MMSIRKVKHQDLSDPDLIIKFELYLIPSKVLTPSSDECGAGIERWSDASEKIAVGAFFTPMRLKLYSHLPRGPLSL